MLGWILWDIAVVAMAAVHLRQRDFDFWHQPLSYHVHASGGSLLTLALAAFGALLVVLGGVIGRWPLRMSEALAKVSLWGAGGWLLLAAAFPSDRWFPWEQTPSAPGLLHASAGVLAPACLMLAMVGVGGGSWMRRLCTFVGLIAGVASVISLAHGFWVDGPPRHLGVAERTVGLAAAGWCAALLAESPWRRGSNVQ